MSRVGIESRLRAIRDAAKRHDPRGYALHNLTPQLRRWHDEWRDECNRIAAERYGDDASARYEAMAEGDDVALPMPLPVAMALNIQSTTGISATASVDDAAEMYRKLLHYEGSER